MDRIRESRKSNGFPRHRHRNLEYEAVELREGSRKIGRNHDRELRKRRRHSHSHRDEGERSTEVSFGNEQNDHVREISRIRLSNTTSFGASDQNHRRSVTAAKPPPFKRTDEIIGVVVPRKARSASVKRLREKWITGGGTEEQIFRRRSNSPSDSTSLDVSSQLKKRKVIGDVDKTSKSSSSDMEIEIAELLSGLRTFKNLESSSEKVEATINHNASMDTETKKWEVYNSTEELVRIQCDQAVDAGCHDGNVTCHENGSLEVEIEKVNSGARFGGASADGKPLSTTRGSQSCMKLDAADKHDSVSTREMSTAPATQRLGKFEIDLMAPPPMMLSPKGNDLSRGNLTSASIKLAPDLEMKRENSIKVEDKVERQATVEKNPEEIEEEANMATMNVLKHYLEKPNNDNDIKINNKLEEQGRNKEQPIALSNPKVEKTACSSSVPLPAAVSGLPSSLSPIGSITMTGGCTPPLQTVVKMNTTTGSSTSAQRVNFALSEPQPKRCATHYQIARKILLKQFTKMNPLLSAAIGSGSLCAPKTNNVNCLLSAESMIINKQSQKHLPSLDQNGTQEKRLTVIGDHNLTATKNSNNPNPVDSIHQMHLLQQGPFAGSTGNLVHGPAFVFSPARYQASVAAATNQAGGVSSPNNTSSYNRSQSSVAGSPCTTSTLPATAIANAMSFSYPHFSANNSPYATLVHNNGYSFPVSSSSLGATAAIRNASSAQTTHILGGPLYSSQTFHSLQYPQQHPHSQAHVQPSYLTTQTSSSSSSQMQPHGAQVNGNSILTSTTAERRSQKQHTLQSHPHKQETEVNGKNVPSVANLTSCPLKNLQGQNFTIPVQPVNFSFKPCATSDSVGGNSGNFGDKQQQALKGGVEVIPSQPFAVSFGSFNGTNLPSNLNFSSMKQNPLVIQSLPDVARQGYQAASTSHIVQQKNYSTTIEKRGGNSSHKDDEKKTTHGKSSANGPTTLVFDNSSKNINFVLSHSNGNWPSHSITSTVTTTMPFSSNTSSSQQSAQSLQLHKQHGMQQQQPAAATRNKASSTNTTSATNFANNGPVFSQSHTQCNSSNQTSHSKITGRTTSYHVHHTPSTTIKTPTTKNDLEKGRFSQGRMQISFGGNYTTSLPSQGKHQLNNSQPLYTTAAGNTFNGGNLKPNLEGWKVDSSVNTSQLQQTENSSGSGQKSSPVCGRNVPSILSSCPSHLSEMK